MHIYSLDKQSGVVVQRWQCLCDRPEMPHQHEFIELVYVASGVGTQSVGGKVYPVHRGDLLYINYGETHELHTDSAFTYYNILVKPEFVSNNIVNSENIDDVFLLFLPDGQEPPHSRSSKVHFTGKTRGEVEHLIAAMYREYEMGAPLCGAVLNGYARALFAHLLRALLPTAAGRPQLLTEDVMAYLNAHFTEPLTLESLSDRCFYHPAYLGRVFRAVYGVGVKEYVRERRMEYAARLLREEPYRAVEDIATATGYTNRARFYRDFREKYGVTPAAFRGEGEKKE